MNIFIIRHAESYTNTQGTIMSSTDLPLTEKGIKQAEATKAYLQSIISPYVFHKVFVSPLLRAKQTAELIYDSLVPIEICNDLKEMDLGKIEGLSWKEREIRYPNIDIDNNLLGFTAPDGESFEDMKSRCIRFLDKLNLLDNNNILIVSHGITIRVMINCILKKNDTAVNYMNWVDNASVTEILVTETRRRVIRFGERNHLTKSGLGSDGYEKWGLFSKIDYNKL